MSFVWTIKLQEENQYVLFSIVIVKDLSRLGRNYVEKRVLQDVHCSGDSVYGKYQQSVFQGNKQRNRPESEWIYAENTHEGIIDKELFRQYKKKSGNLRKNIKRGIS